MTGEAKGGGGGRKRESARHVGQQGLGQNSAGTPSAEMPPKPLVDAKAQGVISRQVCIAQ